LQGIALNNTGCSKKLFHESTSGFESGDYSPLVGSGKRQESWSCKSSRWE